MGIDHVVVAVRDLTVAAKRFESAGHKVSAGGRHEGLGTHNALVPMPSAYIELLSIEDADLVARHGHQQQRALANFLDQGDEGLAAYVLATADIEWVAEVLGAIGIRAVGPYRMQRRSGGGTRASWQLLVPEGSAIRRWFPYFIQWETAPPRGSASRAVDDLAGITVGVPDRERAGQLFSSLGATPGDSDGHFVVGPHTIVTSMQKPEGLVSVQVLRDGSVSDLVCAPPADAGH